jgi:ribosomal protein S18 acetylase RimI-like enzyme
MPTVEYREANPSDIPAMARIRIEGEEGGAPEERMACYPAREHHPQQALMPRVIYVAWEEDALVGYVAGHLTRRHACDGELQWVYVVPKRRGSRVARELLCLLAAWFVEQNASRICVNVDPANTTASRFYTRHGAETLSQHWLVWADISIVLGER